MKKKLTSFILFVSLLLAFAVPALAEPAPEETPLPEKWTPLYTNTSALTEDLTYTNQIFQNGEGRRVESFAVETGPHGAVYPIVATADSLYEAMKPEELTAVMRERGLNVLAAVNADFFYSSAKLPLGGVIEDGVYVTNTDAESLLAFDDDGAFFIEKPDIRLTLHNNGGGGLIFDPERYTWVSNAGKDVSVNHVNKIRNRTGGLFLYTTAYHPEHTDTTRAGWAVRFRVLSGKLTVSGSVELLVEEVLPDCTDIAIGEDYMVLTSPADGPYPEGYKDFAVGDRVTLTSECADARLRRARWATGCGDLIVDNGVITDFENWDKAIAEERHPRTAIGVKSDGSIMALVIDGRSSAYSAGATMYELAAELVEMGCVFAVNLDGGGSSVMALKAPGEETCDIVNRPSGGSSRICSTYILFVSDITPDGVPVSLHLAEDGAFVLTGARTLLSPLAIDRAGSLADVPENIVITAERGTVEDGIYFAPSEPCTDTLTLRSADGMITGTATLHITDTLDSLTVTDLVTGAPPALFEMEPGDTADLALSGTYLRREVLMDGAPTEFSVTEGIGTLTEDGGFTAADPTVPEGEITVSAGGVTVTLPVSLRIRFYDILDHWARAYVTYLYDRGVVTGTPDQLYGPDVPMTRWEFAMMLWRALGSPVLEGESMFTDVPPESEYYEAAKWGGQIGLIYGTDYGIFSPDDPIEREQAFTLVYRLLTLLRKELPEPDLAALDIFPDGAEVDDYAQDALATLITAGVITGSDGYILPHSTVTRAELCKVTCEAVLQWTPPIPEDPDEDTEDPDGETGEEPSEESGEASGEEPGVASQA